MSADFTPTRGTFIDLKPFRFWCQKVLPLVYDDSLSYYELLCKIVDYLNKTMEDVSTLNDDVTNMFEAYTELQNYVNNYFDNLDVQEAINNKLDDMAESGVLDDLMQPTISQRTAEWLASHVTPGEGVIDNSLTIRGASADAAETGKYIFEYRALTGYNIMDDHTKYHSTSAGVEYTWNDSNICHIEGTATDLSFRNIINLPNSLPEGVSPGTNLYFGVLSPKGQLTSKAFVRVYSIDSSNELVYLGRTDKTSVVQIPTGTIGLLVRLEVDNGTVINGDYVPYASVTEPCTAKAMAQDNTCWLYPDPNINYGIVLTNLSTIFRSIHLTKGVYNVTSAINLDAGTALLGETPAFTILKIGSQAVLLRIRGGCVVRSIQFDGGLTQAPTVEGNQIGLYAPEITGYHSVEDCWFIGFSRYGAFYEDGGGSSLNRTHRNNLFTNNYCGIRIKNSEYITITDCSIYRNYYGVYDSSGNTVYSGNGINGNSYGLVLNGTIEVNHAHGIVANCQFNHNSPYALVFENCDNGEIVNACQFHFATIDMKGTNCKGINFANCQFGNPEHIVINKSAGGYSRMTNCMFQGAPTFNVTGGTLERVGCWDMNGNVIG